MLQQNRAFLFGDSLFETIKVVQGGRCLALYAHHERLSMGLQRLAMAPIAFADWEQLLRDHIDSRQDANLRVRISFFRQGAGAYLPTLPYTTAHDIRSVALEEMPYRCPSQGLRLCICDQVRLGADAYSMLKTGSALRYVAGSLYAQQQACDDALLLNHSGRIAEATAANIFLLCGHQLRTPPLSEGCVAGIMRRMLLEQMPLHRYGLEVVEMPISVGDLEQAQEIWLTNMIRGIRWVEQLTAFSGRRWGGEVAAEITQVLNKYWALV